MVVKRGEDVIGEGQLPICLLRLVQPDRLLVAAKTGENTRQKKHHVAREVRRKTHEQKGLDYTIGRHVKQSELVVQQAM